jgi:hypothetical protein
LKGRPVQPTGEKKMTTNHVMETTVPLGRLVPSKLNVRRVDGGWSLGIVSAGRRLQRCCCYDTAQRDESLLTRTSLCAVQIGSWCQAASASAGGALAPVM